MLVYEKKVDEQRHLFGTMGNVPSDDDVQLTYKDEDGATASPTLQDTFLDDGHGGIKMVHDESGIITESELNVFIGDVNIIPGDFEAPEFTVTVTAGEGGVASASPAKATAGTEITLSNTPSAGYEFKSYSSDDVEITNGKFEMPAKAVSISAEFQKVNYTITVNAGENGVATADPVEGTVGTEITLSITPASTYMVDTLEAKDADNNAVIITNNKFTMPASNVTVTVTFKLAG